MRSRRGIAFTQPGEGTLDTLRHGRLLLKRRRAYMQRMFLLKSQRRGRKRLEACRIEATISVAFKPPDDAAPIELMRPLKIRQNLAKDRHLAAWLVQQSLHAVKNGRLVTFHIYLDQSDAIGIDRITIDVIIKSDDFDIHRLCHVARMVEKSGRQ